MAVEFLILIGFIFLVMLLNMIFFYSRYKRCPPDKIMIVYGKTGGEDSPKCYAGGAVFVWPVIQDYKYLDIKAISLPLDFPNILTKNGIRISLTTKFNYAVSNKPDLMINAAERLIGLEQSSIKMLGHDIIVNEMRRIIKNKEVEEIYFETDKLVESIYQIVGNELHKTGLALCNVNIIDIKDKHGYIEAIEKEAIAKGLRNI